MKPEAEAEFKAGAAGGEQSGRTGWGPEAPRTLGSQVLDVSTRRPQLSPGHRMTVDVERGLRLSTEGTAHLQGSNWELHGWGSTETGGKGQGPYGISAKGVTSEIVKHGENLPPQAGLNLHVPQRPAAPPDLSSDWYLFSS